MLHAENCQIEQTGESAIAVKSKGKPFGDFVCESASFDDCLTTRILYFFRRIFMVGLCVSTETEPELEELKKYILRVSSQKSITLQQLVSRAKAANIQVSLDALTEILNGVSCNPTIETIRAIAVGLEEAIEDVFAAALNSQRDVQVSRQLSFTKRLWDKLDEDAERCQKTTEQRLAEILFEYYKLEKVATEKATGNINNGSFDFLIKPESDVQKLINPVEVSAKLKELGYEVSPQSVFFVLSKNNEEVAIETKKLIVSVAKMLYPDIVETIEIDSSMNSNRSDALSSIN
jgi:hypothetical protein